MKKTERKILEEKLLVAIKKVIEDNKTDLTNKVENGIKKSIRQIVKKTNKKRTISKKGKEVALETTKP